MKILLQMKMMSMAAAVVLVSLIATGCFSDKKNIPTWLLALTGGASDSKTITAFSIPSASATGVISGTNISVTVPYGTDVSALAATFNTTGASVDIGMIIQENGVTPNDFSDPVVYRVTAADSSFQDYTVTVTIASNTAKEITAFGFPSVSAIGIVSGSNISVTVPYETNVTALVATFSKTGASVHVGEAVQISEETPNDFTNPVVYRVTAADSSFQDYTVTVTIALNSAKNITAFSFPSVPATGVISGLNISVAVPYETNVTALIATFSTTGMSVTKGDIISVTQISTETPNNFTEPVVYRVTAADSTYQDYIVTVTIALSPAKEITAFSFPSVPVTGVISGTNISVAVPYGTNVTELVATFSTTGASVKVGSTTQTSEGTPNNFTDPVTYRVTAADASIQEYVVTVTVAAAYTVTYNKGAGSDASVVPVDETNYASGASVHVSDNTTTLIGAEIVSGIRQRFLSGWNTDEHATTVQYYAGSSFTITANTTLYAIFTTGTDVLRKTGPAGGLVFYDAGSVQSWGRYLEAAPADATGLFEWKTSTTSTGGTSTTIGSGAANTAAMAGAGHPAAEACRNYSYGVFTSGWFLPSKDELAQIFLNLKPFGLVNMSNFYWSSSEYDATQAWYQYFLFADVRQNFWTKAGNLGVRPVRAFGAPVVPPPANK